MTQTTEKWHAAWGLELAQSAAYLVRLERAPDGPSVQRRQTFPIAEFWQSGSLDADLVNALKQMPQGEPLGVCFPDQAMLCRGFSLPSAQPDATEKMVHAQMEALLSAGPERLASTWYAFADPSNQSMQWVLFCATRREILERLKRVIPTGISVRALLPRAIATAQSWPEGTSAAASQLLLELTHDAATMSLRVNGCLLRCTTLGPDHEHEVEPTDGMSAKAWVRQSRQSYHLLLEGVPRDRWPMHGVIRGTYGQAASLSDALADALNVALHPWPVPADHEAGADESPVLYLGAQGAARLAMEDSPALRINFAQPEKTPAAPVAIRTRRVWGLAVASLVGVALLYGIDRYRSSWLSGQVEQVRAAEAASGGIEQRLAIARYLEKNASPALPGLDAILSAAPPSLSMTSFSLTSTGQFRFVGVLSSPNEVDDFLRKLQASKAMTNVEVRSLRNEQQRWTIELSANASPSAGLLLITPSKPAASPPAEASAKRPAPAATAPATAPVKRGGV